jgi:sugar-specific transcriptional regulator TrmB
MEKELRERIEELEDRLDELESKEERRKIFTIIKICLKVAIIGVIAFGLWKAYDYAKNVIEPIREVANTISNTTNSIDFSKFSDWFKTFD